MELNNFNVGDMIWAIKKVDDEECAFGYLYVAENSDYIICAPQFFGRSDENICKDLHHFQTADNNPQILYIYPKKECFATKKEIGVAIRMRRQENEKMDS